MTRRKLNPIRKYKLRRRNHCRDMRAVGVSIHSVWRAFDPTKLRANIRWWKGVQERLGKVN